MDSKLKNCANTHVLHWGGKLLSLFESGLPYHMEAATLRTWGPETFGGELKAGTAATLGLSALDSMLGFGDAVTAHPHVDQKRNRLLMWSQKKKVVDGSLAFTVTEWDQQWHPQARVAFDMAAGAAPHDFAFTDSFYIWVENRIELTGPALARYLLGQLGPAEAIEIDADLPTRIHLVTRSDSSEAEQLVVETPPWFAIHHSHASEVETEDGEKLITLYSAGWDQRGLKKNGPQFLAAWGGKVPDFDFIPTTYYWKTTIKVKNSEAQLLEHCVHPGLEHTNIDHPHVHPAQEGGAAGTYAYMTYSNSDDLASPPVGWLRLNLQTGDTTLWETPSKGGCFTQEPVVVPKADSDGAWVLGIVSDHRRDATCLCVLDGDRIAQGPVCRMWLPCNRQPYGLHGSFHPASDA